MSRVMGARLPEIRYRGLGPEQRVLSQYRLLPKWYTFSKIAQERLADSHNHRYYNEDYILKYKLVPRRRSEKGRHRVPG